MARLFGIFCLHEWEEEDRAPLVLRRHGQTRDIGVAVVLRCKCCGDMKIKRLSVI